MPTVSSGTHSHYFRFYIVVITLIVGAVFFLLFTNDSKNGLGITSAIVGVTNNNDTEDTDTFGGGVEDEFAAKAGKSGNEVALSLQFNQIPTVRKEARIKEIILKFDDLTTRINVNNDKLELRNLQEVTLRITDFSGNIDFDKVGFSLDGTIKSLEVNNIALSSKGEIGISFDNLDYRFLQLENIILQDVELPTGDGELTVAEKLTYRLEQDGVKLYYFNGKVSIDRETATSLQLEGVTKGISVSGALLNMDLS